MTEIEEFIKVEENSTPKRYNTLKYLIIFIIIIGLAHALDEYSTLATNYIESSILGEFFGYTPEAQKFGVSLISGLGIFTLVLVIFLIFFKGLQDNIGRKKIFLISINGMVLGVFIIIISQNFVIYYLGYTVMSFFVLVDMQYVYINEETTTRKRARSFAAAKIFGLVGILIIPVVRLFVITEENNAWRIVYVIPLIIGLILIVLTSLFLKEPHAYQLVKEDRKNNPEKYEGEKINLKQAYLDLKKTKNWPQVKWLILLMVIIAPFATLNQTHSELFMYQAGVSGIYKDIMLFVSTLATGGAYLFQGVMADRVGRKAAYVTNSFLVGILLPVEFFAMYQPVFYWVAAISQGIRIGAYWNLSDVNQLLLMENSPTRIRGNILVLSILGMLFIAPFGLIANTILTAILYPIQLLLMIIGIPLCFINAILVQIKIKETIDVDITKIEG